MRVAGSDRCFVSSCGRRWEVSIGQLIGVGTIPAGATVVNGVVVPGVVGIGLAAADAVRLVMMDVSSVVRARPQLVHELAQVVIDLPQAGATPPEDNTGIALCVDEAICEFKCITSGLAEVTCPPFGRGCRNASKFCTCVVEPLSLIAVIVRRAGPGRQNYRGIAGPLVQLRSCRPGKHCSRPAKTDAAGLA